MPQKENNSSIRIGVTLLTRNPFMEMLLDQIGVDWQISDRTQEPDFLTSCVILNRSCSAEERTFWIQCLTEQKSLILDTHANLFQLPEQRGWITPPISGKDPYLGKLADLPFRKMSVSTSTKAQHLSNSVYQHPSLPYRWCGWFNEPPMDELSQSIQSYPVSSSQSKDQTLFRNLTYQSLTKSLDPSENIHQIPYGHFRHLLFNLLLQLHEVGSLPLICKSPYPEQAESVFLFRVDSDYSDETAIYKLFTLLDRYQIRSTWFLHTEAHQEHTDLFREYSRHELAVHGHRHQTFKHPDLLADNIQKSLRFVASTHPEQIHFGYAEPFGLYHKALATVLSNFSVQPLAKSTEDRDQSLGFLYSSEFGFDSDNLPHWPIRNKGPLQIPIHPICPGSFSRTRASADEIQRYFVSQLHRTLAREDPLLFYHHPMQPYDDVLENLFQEVHSLKEKGVQIEFLTFSEWALWWIQRHRSRFSVEYELANGGIHIVDHDSESGLPTDRSLFYRVYMNGKSYLVEKGKLKLEQIESRERKPFDSNAFDLSFEVIENRSHLQKFHHFRNQLLNQLGRLYQ